MFEKMLARCEVRLGVDFLSERKELSGLAERIVFTGPIDEYYDFRFGALEYRSLRFEHVRMDSRNHQGVAVMNWTDSSHPYTRTIEHKHFEFGTQPTTVVSREYPYEWRVGEEPYYPINDEKNQTRYERYAAVAAKEDAVSFGGRLGTYRYTDMQDTIIAALEHAGKELT